jgi:hypothetical protein
MFSKDSGFVFVDGHDLRQKDKKSQDWLQSIMSKATR